MENLLPIKNINMFFQPPKNQPTITMLNKNPNIIFTRNFSIVVMLKRKTLKLMRGMWRFEFAY